jgi:hypothetical protein
LPSSAPAPIGLEAAALALELGFDAHVFERGEPGAHALAWGHVRMFTPWRMNVGPASARLLSRHGWNAPEATALPTGAELAERLLAPLAGAPELEPRVHAHQQVVHVSRHGARKHDRAGSAPRVEHPFRLLVRDAGGRESFLHAHALIDATGTYGQPLWAGTGGIPARGETYLAPQMSYHPDDVLGLRRERYAGKTTLVIGGGSSAVTTVAALEQLAREIPGTRVAWVTRREAPGFAARSRTTRCPRARRCTPMGAGSSPAARRTWRGGVAARCEGLEYNSATHRYRVQFAAGMAPASRTPTRSSSTAASVRTPRSTASCAWTSATRRSRPETGRRSSPGGTSDCAKLPAFDAATLATPEPRFFILGAKSYGRSSAFLLETGYKQVAGALAALAEAAGLRAPQEA